MSGVDTTLFAIDAYPGLPCFLVGASMGGAIALSVTLACQDAAEDTTCYAARSAVRGAVLLAPMTNIAEKSKPSPWVMPLLQAPAETIASRACACAPFSLPW